VVGVARFAGWHIRSLEHVPPIVDPAVASS
jgi:hypothetical protein